MKGPQKLATRIFGSSSFIVAVMVSPSIYFAMTGPFTAVTSCVIGTLVGAFCTAVLLGKRLEF